MSRPVNTAKAICVLGMHRSGTSVLARLLNCLGVELGPSQQIMAPGDANPRGFWEHEGIVDINDHVLARFGGDWSHPPNWADDWSDDPRLDDLYDRARSLIAADFTDPSLWGWKDPRTCVTLPFWRRVVPGCRFVIGVRHPADVARSLIRRDRFTPARAMWLWARYNRDALRDMVDGNRCLVRYEQTVREPLRSIEHLAQFLGRPELASDDQLRRQVADFVDPHLQHHRENRSVWDTPSLREPGALLDSAWRMIDEPLTESAAPAAALLDEAVTMLAPTIAAEDTAAASWFALRREAERLFARVVPAESRVILIDDCHWTEDDRFADRPTIPFLEHGGRYAGPPLDDPTAIDALERLRERGASHVAIAEPSMWWLDHYVGFRDHLNERYRRLHADDHLVVFDLSTPSVAAHRIGVDVATGADVDIAFVLGCARSGTSILGEMIAAHPAVRYLFEAHDAWNLAGAGPDGSDRLVPADVPDDARDRIRRWFVQHAHAAPRLVEKNPRSALRVPLIRSIFPNARLIHIVRDGRDVACSMMPGCGGDTWSHLKPPGWQRIMEKYTGALRCAHAWRAVVGIVHDDLRQTPHLQVRYEDLVADPRRESLRILEFLGLPAAHEVDAFCDRVADRTAGSYHARHQSDWYRGDHSVRVGRWRENLTDEEAAAVNELLAPTLPQFGYSA